MEIHFMFEIAKHLGAVYCILIKFIELRVA